MVANTFTSLAAVVATISPPSTVKSPVIPTVLSKVAAPVTAILEITTDPAPFALRFKLTCVSPPCAAIMGPLLVAAFVILISLIADVVAPKTIDSLPFASAI